MLTDVYLVCACKMLIISDVYNVYNVYDVNAYVLVIDWQPKDMKKAHNQWSCASSLMRFAHLEWYPPESG